MFLPIAQCLPQPQLQVTKPDYKLAFTRVHKTQVFMLAEQALCRLNYSPLKQSAFDNSPTEKKKKRTRTKIQLKKDLFNAWCSIKKFS